MLKSSSQTLKNTTKMSPTPQSTPTTTAKSNDREKPNLVKKISLQEGLGSVSKVLESMKLTDAVKGYKYVNGKFSGYMNKKEQNDSKNNKEISKNIDKERPNVNFEEKCDHDKTISNEVTPDNKDYEKKLSDVVDENKKFKDESEDKKRISISDDNTKKIPAVGFKTDRGIEYAIESAPDLIIKKVSVTCDEKLVKPEIEVKNVNSIENKIKKDSIKNIETLPENHSAESSITPEKDNQEDGVKSIQLAEAHSRVFNAFSKAFNRQNVQFENGEYRNTSYLSFKPDTS